jgi:hypothetical protein
MTAEKRKQQYTLGRLFYMGSICVFACTALISLLCCFFDKFTDERIALVLMNSWFMLFTMDIVTARFKRQNEHSFWNNWIIFKRNSHKKDNNETENINTVEMQEQKKVNS